MIPAIVNTLLERGSLGSHVATRAAVAYGLAFMRLERSNSQALFVRSGSEGTDWYRHFQQLSQEHPEIRQLIELTPRGFAWAESLAPDERLEIARYIRDNDPVQMRGHLR